MEILQFNHGKDVELIDAVNIEFQHLINRAAAFNKNRYDAIFIPYLDETARSQVLYAALEIITTMRGMPLYLRKKDAKLSFVNKNNSNCIFLSRRNMAKISKDNKKLCFDTFFEDEAKPVIAKYPRIFAWYTKDMIERIARILLNGEEG